MMHQRTLIPLHWESYQNKTTLINLEVFVQNTRLKPKMIEN